MGMARSCPDLRPMVCRMRTVCVPSLPPIRPWLRRRSRELTDMNHLMRRSFISDYRPLTAHDRLFLFRHVLQDFPGTGDRALAAGPQHLRQFVHARFVIERCDVRDGAFAVDGLLDLEVGIAVSS